jgi:hypothetical protein
MHLRGQIRARIGDKLKTIDGLQDHVTFDFPSTVDDRDLPWAFVWLGNEDIDPITQGAKQSRELQLYIDLIARDRSDVVERIEEIAARIEAEMHADKSIGGLVIHSFLRAYTLDRDETGATLVLRFRLQYVLTYLTAAGNPSAVC